MVLDLLLEDTIKSAIAIYQTMEANRPFTTVSNWLPIHSSKIKKLEQLLVASEEEHINQCILKPADRILHLQNDPAVKSEYCIKLKIIVNILSYCAKVTLGDSAEDAHQNIQKLFDDYLKIFGDVANKEKLLIQVEQFFVEALRLEKYIALQKFTKLKQFYDDLKIDLETKHIPFQNKIANQANEITALHEIIKQKESEIATLHEILKEKEIANSKMQDALQKNSPTNRYITFIKPVADQNRHDRITHQQPRL